MGYSVLTEPVIPVLMLDGKVKDIGIKGVFLEAHHIKDISGSNPLERYAVLRLLIAFAMDMIHPETSYDRMDLLQAGRFDADTLEEYIRVCDQDGPRFDLFDPVSPFLQSKYDERLDAKAKKPIAVILHALPSGNNHIFIDHRLADSHQISIPSAFRALCASYVFCVGGTAGPSSVNNTPPLFAVMIGQNLFETIVINMLSKAEAAPLQFGLGDVPWRKQRAVIPGERVASVSLLEGLTWMPRRITLICEDNSEMVSSVYCQAGLDFRGNWLKRQGVKNGFRVLEAHINGKGEILTGTKPSGEFHVAGVPFEGVLQICDQEAFRTGFVNGIGAEKAYGFGMLMVKKV